MELAYSISKYIMLIPKPGSKVIIIYLEDPFWVNYIWPHLDSLRKPICFSCYQEIDRQWKVGWNTGIIPIWHQEENRSILCQARSARRQTEEEEKEEAGQEAKEFQLYNNWVKYVWGWMLGKRKDWGAAGFCNTCVCMYIHCCRQNYSTWCWLWEDLAVIFAHSPVQSVEVAVGDSGSQCS